MDWKAASIIGFTLIIGIALGASLDLVRSPLLGKDYAFQVRLGEGTFTNPLLECEVALGTLNAQKVNFKPALNGFIEDEIESRPEITEVAVQFRDLNNGPTFGYKNEDPFIPASLLKVPVLMTFFKHAEDNPDILAQRVTFSVDKQISVSQAITPQTSLIVGESYSVSELLNRMITESDNQALVLLWDLLPDSEYRELHRLLGVSEDVLFSQTAALSVKEYGAFFRILYNASFLSRTFSEEALRLLSETSFRGGLREGIPNDIPVSHKFGERSFEDGVEQFHDCGIVYYAPRPYMLCVMTRGKDFSALERSVVEIASFVHQQVITL